MDVAVVFGYLSLIWAVFNLIWAVFRGQAMKGVIYGSVLLIGAIIALNIGGVLTAETWHWFGIGVFSLEFAYHFIKGHRGKMVLFGILLFASLVLGW